MSGYKVKIDYGNGKGLVAMTCSSTTCKLSSNSLPVGVNSASYKIGIYNAQGILQGATTDGTYVINSPLTTGYSKISNTGTVLSDNAILGNGANDWACTKDNKTGLIWEVKTTDSGTRDMSKKYTNWFAGETGYGLSGNADYFANAVNKQSLCGASNWRLPTNDELKGLILCSDGQYTVLAKEVDGNICTNITSVVLPSVNTIYFPNTQTFAFWTSSISASIANSAWYVNSNGGQSATFSKASSYYVRLVHDDKPITSNIQNTVADKTAADYLTGLKADADKTVADYLTTLKAAAEKTSSDYLTSLKSLADKTAADYLTNLKSIAEKTASDYLTSLKSTADKTAADYLTGLKAIADKNASTPNTTGYSKISNSGAVLPETAVLGSGVNDWACTKDNKTGLVWEVKTDDNSFRDKDWYYSWYDPSSSQIGSYSGLQNNGYCQGTDCDTNAYKNAVNKQTLCGASNWRAPTNEELKNLVFCADGQYNLTPNKSGYICTTNTQVSKTPFINTTYFPNTQALPFWSSSNYTGNSTKALWGIDFGSGYTDFLNGPQYYVRLVHEDKSVTDYLTAQKAVADKTAADYLSILKATAEKTAADYLTSLKSTADKTVADYLTTQKAAADKTAADYLATLKAAADSSTKTPSTSSTAYVKISNTGATLPDSAKLGTGANDWACTKDKATGLIWEVKTTDDGLRDSVKTYTFQNANDLITAVNKVTLCGSNTWRLPNKSELQTLVSTSSNISPLLNNSYFPNTQSSYYWTVTQDGCMIFNGVTGCWNYAYIINFGLSTNNLTTDGTQNYHYVRLVYK